MRVNNIQKKEAAAFRLREGKMKKRENIDIDFEPFNSPAKMPFFSKMENKPSEIEAHVLTPPKLRSKDGVTGFDMNGKYYKANSFRLTKFNPFEEYVHQNLGVLECFINTCSIHSQKCKCEL